MTAPLSLPLAFFFAAPLLQALTTAAVAAGVVAVPIVIHLLNRKRYRVVEWAAMRFLLAAQRKNTRRMRIEQLLLLMCRVMIVLLIVLAMASVMGWAEACWSALFPNLGRETRREIRTHRVLVVDGSFSMGAKIEDGTCFDKARELAKKLVDDSSSGDAFSVVLMSAPPRRIIPEPSIDASKVTAEIEAMRMPHGNADLVATLNTVEDMLRKSPGKNFDHREVYFFTDLQQSTWIDDKPANLTEVLQKIRKRARTFFVDVGRDGLANLAVTNLSMPFPPASTSADTTISTNIHNYGTENREGLKVELWVGKARAGRTDREFEMHLARTAPPRNIPAKGDLTVNFTYRFPAAGDYAVQVRIDHDVLEVDDARSAVVSVKDTIPVLLVNGKPASIDVERATETLKVALNPYREETANDVPFRPTVLTEDDFKKENLGRLSPYDCVFFCDVQGMNEAEVERIRTHIYSGGGAVFCLGDNVDPAAYNRLLYRDGKGILPAALGDRRFYRNAADRPVTFNFDHWEDKSAQQEPFKDLLAAFTGDFKTSLLSARFQKYYELKPAKDAPPPVLAFVPAPGEKAESAYPHGEPAVVDWQPLLPRNGDEATGSGDPRQGSGSADPRKTRDARRTLARGRVVLFASTANTDWNSWAASPSYPAFMQELVRYASAGRLREQTLTVGDPLEEYLPVTGSAEYTVHTPDGRKVTTATVDLQETSVLRFTDNEVGGTDLSGVYRAVREDAKELLFAVNPPVATERYNVPESDLARTSEEELRKTYPEWEPQVVTSPEAGQLGVEPETGGSDEEGASEVVESKHFGPIIADVLLILVVGLFFAEMVMAWRFAHHTAVAGAAGGSRPPAVPVPIVAALFSGLLLALLAFVLIHAVAANNFLGFLPGGLHEIIRHWVGAPEALPGETSNLSPRFYPFLVNRSVDFMLAVLIDVAGIALTIVIYVLEGNTVTLGYRMALAGIRICLLQVIVLVLLPQFGLTFERESWPDIAILIDDSGSMSTVDDYKDKGVRDAAEQLADLEGLTRADRLSLAKALVTREEHDWLTRLVKEKKFRAHVYHFSSKAQSIADATEPKDINNAIRAISELEATPKNDSTQIGPAVRQALADFRGASLTAAIVLTDGINTQGEDLSKIAAHARRMDVPLYFVGVGDSYPVTDLELHDLSVDDAVFVNDWLIFEARLSSRGFKNISTRVEVREKGKDKVLAEQPIQIDDSGKTIKIRLRYQPTEPGEKTYVMDVPLQEGESNKDNNHLERRILIREARPIKVLYIEGYPRWEYRYLKTLLARESDRIKDNKSVELKVFLQEADPEFSAQDRDALAEIPARTDLFTYDVVLLGDVNPADPRVADHVKDLTDFVKEKGGGLAMIAGQRYAPNDYRETPLRDVLPIDILDPKKAVGDWTESYRPELTPVGKLHPVFRFSSDDAENEEIWNALPPLFWHSEGYRARSVAEVLMVHPKQTVAEQGGATQPLPLVAQQFVGSGRCMFLGIDETWRWRFRENELHFNQFWLQTVRYLARTRIGRIDLRLDKQTSYRRGDPIKVTVRFPDDAPAPAVDTRVEVAIKRLPPRNPSDTSHETTGVKEWHVQLAQVEGSRATFQSIHTETPEGDYQFELVSPFLPDPKPRVECRVLAPPTEMEVLQMNQTDMQSAARETGGRFYTLADGYRLIDDLPHGSRATLSAAGDKILWNTLPVLGLVMFFFTAEWVLRKLGHLL